MKKLSDKVTFKHGATIANRMVQPPMLTSSGVNGKVSDDTLKYWQARNDSAGMIITEYFYVSPAGGPSTTWAEDRTQLAVYDDKFLPGVSKLAKTMKANGNKAILQIAHTGREANWRAHLGLPVYAPTSANYSFLPYGVQAFTTAEVEQVIKDFGVATKRAIEAGFDGVEIHGANHYLIQQFFSRFSNKREDKWGDYSAFPLAVAKEVASVVKEDAPNDFILGYRISPEEINPNSVGYTWHESTRLVDKLTDQIDFDYIHLSLPNYNAKPKDSNKTFAQLFKPVIGDATKLIIVGNVMSQEAAEDALKYADLIAAGRAQIIDANFARKIVSGQGNQVITEMSDAEEIDQKLTPGLREVFDPKTRRPNFGKMVQNVDYSKALKIED